MSASRTIYLLFGFGKKLSGFEDFDDDIEGYFGEKIEDFESWEFERCFFEMLEMIADYFNVDMDYLTGRSSVERQYTF